MSLVPILGEVIDRLPDWQDASWTELDGGLSNRTWLLEKDGTRAVLKFDPELREAPYNTRKEEARLQSIAARVGIANPVLYVDDRTLLSEFVDGAVWTAASLRDNDNLEQLAESLRRLHSMPPAGRSFDAAAAANIYARDIDRDPEIVALCRSTIDACEKPQRLSFCHNDLVAENIIATPTIRFLDWEYACDNDPLFDLATIVEHHELQEHHAAHLHDAYFEGEGAQWQSRLLEQQRLYRALLWLWMASRPGSCEAVLQRVAERLTTSCS